MLIVYYQNYLRIENTKKRRLKKKFEAQSQSHREKRVESRGGEKLEV